MKKFDPHGVTPAGHEKTIFPTATFPDVQVCSVVVCAGSLTLYLGLGGRAGQRPAQPKQELWKTLVLPHQRDLLSRSYAWALLLLQFFRNEGAYA